MEISFSKLRCKDVVNITDGRNYGNIIDIIIDTKYGTVAGIVVQNSKSVINLFKSNNDIFIPYNRICKIGKDIILVDIIIHTNNSKNNANILNKEAENESEEIKNLIINNDK